LLRVALPSSKQKHQIGMLSKELGRTAGCHTGGCKEKAQDESNVDFLSTGLGQLSECSDADDSSSQEDYSDDSDDKFVAPDCQVESGEPPSIGSQLHSKGTCRPCTFFSYGKCRVGKICRYRHIPHPKLFKNKGGSDIIGEVEHQSQKEVARRNGVDAGGCKISL